MGKRGRKEINKKKFGKKEVRKEGDKGGEEIIH